MRYKWVLPAIAFFSFSSAGMSFAAQSIDVKQMVVLGDSYSDNGNTFRASGDTYPGEAYYKGHFSNGVNWSEYLSKSLGVKAFRNYAYGQAQVLGDVNLQTHSNTSDKQAWKFTIPDLAGEVGEYINGGNLDPAHTLYFIFIGTNDFLNYTPGTKQQDQQFVVRTFEGLEVQVNRLKVLGASRIVIFNMRDLELSPLAYQLAEKQGNNYTSKLNAMVSAYNNLLLQKYGYSKNTLVYNINEFDAVNFKSKNPQPCYVNEGNYIDKVNLVCTDPKSHFFYDRIHPTTSINRLISEDLLASLKRKGW